MDISIAGGNEFVNVSADGGESSENIRIIFPLDIDAYDERFVLINDRQFSISVEIRVASVYMQDRSLLAKC